MYITKSQNCQDIKTHHQGHQCQDLVLHLARCECKANERSRDHWQLRSHLGRQVDPLQKDPRSTNYGSSDKGLAGPKRVVLVFVI